MKILIANTLYFPEIVGGAEISTQILAEGLVQAGLEVCVACATGTGTDRTEVLNGVTIYYLRLANVYWPHTPHRRSRLMRAIWHALDVKNIVMTRKLAKIIRHEKPDIVSTSNLSCLSIGIWRIANQAGVRIVHTLRDYYLICPTARMFSDNQRCTRQCRLCALYAQPKRRESDRVDVAVGVSRHILKQHVDNGFFAHANQTVVINDCYLPLPPKQVAATSPPRDSTEGSVASTITRFGILGRISAEKGIEPVIEQLLAQRALDWELSIGGVGSPAYVGALRAAYPDPRICYTGYIEPDQFFQNIDILIVPSRWQEPFGRVTVEAYSHGIPVVGADSGGIPEVIEPHSRLVFDPSQPASLLEQLLAAKQLLRDPDLKDILLRHAERFSPARMIAAYLEVYRATLELEHLPAAYADALGRQD